uniref:Uncharacterized protein n=1 Tax=Candidatus Kentrum sp. SD TaxID=2126332 RepID=A0A450YNG5_9GAMM|nr:MAG: hypothetical protein BECKSD772F_GA0070984_10099 [Candidatus Kentron sp. SD]VFK43068.1 MAG: hypothetical protein BECKSD772E_GA0070983_10229 [Candidatus Kentron sp. SD]
MGWTCCTIWAGKLAAAPGAVGGRSVSFRRTRRYFNNSPVISTGGRNLFVLVKFRIPKISPFGRDDRERLTDKFSPSRNYEGWAKRSAPIIGYRGLCGKIPPWRYHHPTRSREYSCVAGAYPFMPVASGYAGQSFLLYPLSLESLTHNHHHKWIRFSRSFTSAELWFIGLRRSLASLYPWEQGRIAWSRWLPARRGREYIANHEKHEKTQKSDAFFCEFSCFSRLYIYIFLKSHIDVSER